VIFYGALYGMHGIESFYWSISSRCCEGFWTWTLEPVQNKMEKVDRTGFRSYHEEEIYREKGVMNEWRI